MRIRNKGIEIVLNFNTFYFRDEIFEDEWEKYVSSLVQKLLMLKNDIQTEGLSIKLLTKYLQSENGLDAVLALMGISQESFVRLITFLKIVNDPEANALINKKYWKILYKETEVRFDRLKKEIKNNEKVAKGIASLLIRGSDLPVIRNVLPLFEFKKFDISKLNFEVTSLIDTIIRYKTKGQYSASAQNNPESVIKKLLEKNGIKFATGKLKGVRRNLDFIIPNKDEPMIIIESSYEITTGSGMGDKAKIEIEVSKDIKKNYPNAYFIGFVDGIGWYVRKSDLKRVVLAFDEVFTFHKIQLQRFEKFIKEVMKL
ncbi:DpnII restriction endonuclease [Candidatus Kryptobacter tengchongensis]|nr:DpnII restriction endonuclease [Candidatus Kryptobacter tengchongensis]CUU07861.1 DpnII restriction endonuclease [Candidatus Kryptobacter tengchongensis]